MGGSLGARRLPGAELPPRIFASGYAVRVPVLDTTIYLDYLARRARAAGAQFTEAAVGSIDDIASGYDVVVNCSGAGAKTLVPDPDVEPHRGQVAVVAALDLPYAVVCDDPPLMYAIPRRADCVLGGTNTISENIEPAAEDRLRITTEAARFSASRRHLSSLTGSVYDRSAARAFVWKPNSFAMGARSSTTTATEAPASRSRGAARPPWLLLRRPRTADVAVFQRIFSVA
jgi:hypothetical protein